MSFLVLEGSKSRLFIGLPDNWRSCPEAECIWGKPDRILYRLRTIPQMSGSIRGLRTTVDLGTRRDSADHRAKIADSHTGAEVPWDGSLACEMERRGANGPEGLQSFPVGNASNYPEAP